MVGNCVVNQVKFGTFVVRTVETNLGHAIIHEDSVAMFRVRSTIHACHEGIGYRDGFGSWVVFWDSGCTTYPSKKEVIVIEQRR